MVKLWAGVVEKRQAARAAKAAGSPSAEEREVSVAEYFQAYVDSGIRPWRYALRHPVHLVRACHNLMRLPQLTAELSDSDGGRAVSEGLGRVRPLLRTPIHSAVTVLELPDTPEEYSAGRHKQTLRRKCREAEKRGVRWAAVQKPKERERLADLADERDRTHPRDEYRNVSGANRELLIHPLMLAAYAADGRPILVSITPTDGRWAVLQYFRTLEDTPEASAARYLLTKVLAEHLIQRGVRFLADNASPMGINSGLRHFQRMLGFRIVRVDRRPARTAPLRVVPASEPAVATRMSLVSDGSPRTASADRPASQVQRDRERRNQAQPKRATA